jgi:hypothetical protein
MTYRTYCDKQLIISKVSCQEHIYVPLSAHCRHPRIQSVVPRPTSHHLIQLVMIRHIMQLGLSSLTIHPVLKSYTLHHMAHQAQVGLVVHQYITLYLHVVLRHQVFTVNEEKVLPPNHILLLSERI